MRIVPAFVLLLLVTLNCFGQTSRDSKRDAAKPQPRQTPEKFNFDVKGKEVVRPEAVYVRASSNFAVFPENGRMVIEADGNLFKLKAVPAGCHKRKCVNLGANVDFATFEQIAKSGKVTVRAARYTFDLGAGGREAMGDMLRAIESPPENP